MTNNDLDKLREARDRLDAVIRAQEFMAWATTNHIPMPENPDLEAVWFAGEPKSTQRLVDFVLDLMTGKV
jgi:hypothetical protein